MSSVVLRSTPRIWSFIRFTFAALFFVVAIWSTSARAGDDLAAETFIKGLANGAIDILGNEGTSLDARKRAFSDLVVANTDIEGIGYFTLGRYRRIATEAELQEFLELFEQYTANFYKTRLGDYSGERLSVTGSIARSTNDIIVTSELRLDRSPNPISLNWRLVKSEKNYAIRDLEVMGIWLGIEQRSQFTSVIANNGGRFTALLERLRTKVSSGQGLSTGSASLSTNP